MVSQPVAMLLVAGTRNRGRRRSPARRSFRPTPWLAAPRARFPPTSRPSRPFKSKSNNPTSPLRRAFSAGFSACLRNSAIGLRPVDTPQAQVAGFISTTKAYGKPERREESRRGTHECVRHGLRSQANQTHGASSQSAGV